MERVRRTSAHWSPLGHRLWAALAVTLCVPSPAAGCTSSGTSASSVSSSGATSTSAPPASGGVEPKVLCIDSFGGEIGVAGTFGYSSTSSGPVTIPGGPSNQIVDADGALLTTNRRPCSHPARRLRRRMGGGRAVRRDLVGRGADGVAHEAAATAVVGPPCPNHMPPVDPPDQRTADSRHRRRHP